MRYVRVRDSAMRSLRAMVAAAVLAQRPRTATYKESAARLLRALCSSPAACSSPYDYKSDYKLRAVATRVTSSIL